MPDVTEHPDPGADASVRAVRSGDTAALALLLADHPALATARVRGHGGRTLLHIATDWPGHLPHVANTIAVLARHGADLDARGPGAHPETPLHWAASSDDVDAIDALLTAGAGIDARGAVIGGGTPLNDATAFGQWHAARLLVARGAAVSPWDAAALGMTESVAAFLGAEPPHQTEALPASDTPAGEHPSASQTHDSDDSDAAQGLDGLLWAACHGGHRDTTDLLLDAGADPSWVGWDGLTALGAAERSGATDLVAWLRTRGAPAAGRE